MKLVVGLGNPGSDYAGTRHNIGFEVIDQLAARLGWIASPEQFNRLAKTKFGGLALDGTIGAEKVLLLKPMTFMKRQRKSGPGRDELFISSRRRTS